MNTVTTNHLIPSYQLSDAELAARLKARFPGENAQTLYGQFVRERNLMPEINAKKFAELLASVAPNLHQRSDVLTFAPTHRSVLTDELVQVRVKPDGVRCLLYASGSTGSFPLDEYMPDGYKFNDQYVPLGPRV